MSSEGWFKRTVYTYSSLLANESNEANAKQLLLDFLASVTQSSESNDYLENLFSTQSITREDFSYNNGRFLKETRNKLDLKR